MPSHLHGGPPRLESARRVVHEPRLQRWGERALRHALRERHPPQQRHQLASVAYAEGEGVGSVSERAELRHQGLVEADRARPALVQHNQREGGREGGGRRGLAGEGLNERVIEIVCEGNV